MIVAKLFTREEGGKWEPYKGSIVKQKFEGLIGRGVNFLIINENNIPSTWGSLMFSDGSIYDNAKKGYRSESDFPKDETIEYMNKILNGELK